MTHIHRKRFKGFLDVAYKSTDTIAQLKTRIATMTGLRVSHISYHGLYVSKSTRLAHLVPDFSPTDDDDHHHHDQISPPRFAVHTKTLAGKELVVRTLTGKMHVVFLPITSTVRELKEEIRDLEDTLNLESLRLLFTGKVLEDEKRLMDYNIGQNSMIDQAEPPPASCMIKSRCNSSASGGYGYVIENLNRENLLEPGEQVEFRESGAAWRVATAGLNVEGVCQNSACVGFDKMVICNMGYVAFNFGEMEGHCPMCGQGVEAFSCGFTSCQWMYEGRIKVPPTHHGADQQIHCMQQISRPVQDIRSSWMEAGNQYELFHLQEEDDDAVLTQWENLIVTAKKLRPIAAHKLNRVSRPGAECSICYDEFHLNTAAKAAHFYAGAAAAECGHTFHLECVTLWKASGGTSCPMCRDSIA